MLYDRSLEIFKAVAELKSFSRAAESLHITHTAIIRQINNLESEMDVLSEMLRADGLIAEEDGDDEEKPRSMPSHG